MRQRLRKFRTLSRRDRTLAVEAAIMLALASLLLALLPFRHVARWLGRLDREMGAQIDPPPLRPIGRAVERAARHLPWQPLCLPQAMAARAMLRRRGIASTLHFGMKLDGPDRAMRAHAWLTVGTTGVVGGTVADEFTVLARFSR